MAEWVQIPLERDVMKSRENAAQFCAAYLPPTMSKKCCAVCLATRKLNASVHCVAFQYQWSSYCALSWIHYSYFCYVRKNHHECQSTYWQSCGQLSPFCSHKLDLFYIRFEIQKYCVAFNARICNAFAFAFVYNVPGSDLWINLSLVSMSSIMFPGFYCMIWSKLHEYRFGCQKSTQFVCGWLMLMWAAIILRTQAQFISDSQCCFDTVCLPIFQSRDNNT